MSDPMYVYVAGPLSDLPPQYLANVARMTQVSRSLAESGYITINPAADMLEGLMSPAPWPLSLYHSRSMGLLRLLEGRRGALYVVSVRHADGTISGGVTAEIAEAFRLRIPVVWTREELDELRDARP